MRRDAGKPTEDSFTPVCREDRVLQRLDDQGADMRADEVIGQGNLERRDG